MLHLLVKFSFYKLKKHSVYHKADAVSRLSGKIGVCVVTAGPGKSFFILFKKLNHRFFYSRFNQYRNSNKKCSNG
jgi:hypothetical protein